MVVSMVASPAIPRVQLPLENCVYCWYAANDAPFPALWSSTICDEHVHQYFPQSHVENVSQSVDARLPIDHAMTIDELVSSLSAFETVYEVWS